MRILPLLLLAAALSVGANALAADVATSGTTCVVVDVEGRTIAVDTGCVPRQQPTFHPES